MNHPYNLANEAPAIIDQPDAPTTIQAITARLRDRCEAVSRASPNADHQRLSIAAPSVGSAVRQSAGGATALAVGGGVR